MSKAGKGETLMLGVAKENMNPPMEGREVIYPVNSPVKGVESDLFVRVMVFGEAGSDRPAAALAVFDTLYIHPEFARDIREAAARAVPGLSAANIMLSSTHTHSSPPLRDFDMNGRGWVFKFKGTESEAIDTSDNSRGWAGRVALRKIGETGHVAKADPEHLAKVKSGAVRAMERAWQSRKEVRAGVGLTEARLAHNRRVVDANGKATNDWNDPEGRHQGFCDPHVRFVVFRDAADNKIRAVLSGYGCHPVTLGTKNPQPSPDYVGTMVRKIEAATGAELALNVTTGGGDINPRRGLGDVSVTRAMGEAMGEIVLEAIERTSPLKPSPIAVATTPLEMLVRATGGMGPAELLPGHATSADGKSVRTEVQAIRIGDLAFVSAPGELFAELVVAVENLSPVKHTIVVGHANDALGYLCTETAEREGGYEALSGSAVSGPQRPFLAAARQALEDVAKAK